MRETEEAFERRLRAADGGQPAAPATSADDQEAAELLALAQRLQRLQHIELPRATQQRILTRALNTPLPQPGPRILQFRPRPAELTRVLTRVAASVAAVLVLAYGTVSVSAASPPDSPLYTVKLLVEDVRIAVAPSEQKTRLYVEQATRRLEETETMIETGRISAAERSADDAARRLVAAEAAVQTNARPEVRETITDTASRAREAFDRLEQQGGTPPRLTPVTATAVVVVRQNTPTSGPTVEPTPAPDETTPTAETNAATAATPENAAAGAPSGTFAPIAATPRPTTAVAPTAPRPTPRPTDAAAVAAPGGPTFVPIASSPVPPAASSTVRVAAPVQGFDTIEPQPTQVVRPTVVVPPPPPPVIIPPPTALPAVAPPPPTAAPTARPTNTVTRQPGTTGSASPPSPTVTRVPGIN